MHAVSILQPHATLIAKGYQWVVNHSWSPAYRGLLAIHARESTELLSARDIRERRYPLGVVVAVARLIECFTRLHLDMLLADGYADSRVGHAGRTTGEILDHPYALGPHVWILADAVPLSQPLPFRTQKGIWNWPTPPSLTTAYYNRLRELRQKQAVGG